jgi:FixJ family two-component response regulator
MICGRSMRPWPSKVKWRSQLIGSPVFSPAERTAAIVLVEDDFAVRESLRFSLESEGFNVITCETGEELVTLRLPDPPACLLLDHHLGNGMTGLEALKILRTRGVTLPAIAITTIANTAVRRKARDLGAEVIEKPLLGDALFRAIGAAFPATGADQLLNALAAADRTG